MTKKKSQKSNPQSIEKLRTLLLSWQQAERSYRMYDYSSDSPVLSVIARGRGLLEGGVELNCIDTGTAYSLSVSRPLI